MPQLAAQRCGRLVASLQLLQRYPRRRPQLVADAGQGHGDARVEHVAQLHEEDALLVAAQRGQRHRDARAARAASRGGQCSGRERMRRKTICFETRGPRPYTATVRSRSASVRPIRRTRVCSLVGREARQ